MVPRVPPAMMPIRVQYQMFMPPRRKQMLPDSDTTMAISPDAQANSVIGCITAVSRSHARVASPIATTGMAR